MQPPITPERHTRQQLPADRLTRLALTLPPVSCGSASRAFRELVEVSGAARVGNVWYFHGSGSLEDDSDVQRASVKHGARTEAMGSVLGVPGRSPPPRNQTRYRLSNSARLCSIGISLARPHPWSEAHSAKVLSSYHWGRDLCMEERFCGDYTKTCRICTR